MAIGFVIVYGTLSILSLLIYFLIKKLNWNPWFRTLAIIPFIAYWIWSYESPDSYFYYAYREVTNQQLPEHFEIVERYQSPFDDMGDYTTFAVFKVEPSDAKRVIHSFKSEPLDSLVIVGNPPNLVTKYLNRNKGLSITQEFKYSDTDQIEMYGAVLSNKRTIVVYRSSW